METALLASLLGLITAPGIIDEQIKPALLGADAVKYSADLIIIAMVTAHRNPQASCLGHERGRLMNGSRERHGRMARMLGPSGHVDCRAPFPQRLSNPFSNPATRSRHERNFIM
jgi:hypothetical protein